MNMYRHRCTLAVALVVIVGGAVASAQVQDFKPVTDAMLRILTQPTGLTGGARSMGGATVR